MGNPHFAILPQNMSPERPDSPTNRIKWHLGLVYFGSLLRCNMDNMYRTTHLLQKKNTTPNSYSSSCDIEMFVVMQRRQPKMANNGLSSPYSFDRHSTKQKKKFAIRYYLI